MLSRFKLGPQAQARPSSALTLDLRGKDRLRVNNTRGSQRSLAIWNLLWGHRNLRCLPVSLSAQRVHVYHSFDSSTHTYLPSPAHCPTCSLRRHPEITFPLPLCPCRPRPLGLSHPSFVAAPGRGFGLSRWYGESGWLIPRGTALRRLRIEGIKSKATLGHIARSCIKTNQRKHKPRACGCRSVVQ